MKYRLPLIMTLIFIAGTIPAGAQSNVTYIADEKIPTYQYGETISFVMKFVDPVLEAYGSDPTYQLLVYKGPFGKPTPVEMEKNGDHWTAHYSESDTSTKTLFFSYQATDKVGTVYPLSFPEGNYQQAVLRESPQKPSRGSYLELAISYTGDSLIKRRDLNLAIAAVNKELEFFPDNLEAHTLKYKISLEETTDQKRTIRTIEKQIDRMVTDWPDELKMLKFGVNSFKMIGKKERAAELTTRIIEKFPQSELAAEKEFSEIMQLTDAGARATRLDAFLLSFQNPAWTEYALTALANTDIELNDQANMIKTGDRLLETATTPGSASALAGLAGVLSESNIYQDKAEQYALKAIELIQQAKEMAAPPEMSAEDWQEQLVNTSARYLDILGWIRVSRGNVLAGLKDLETAAENTSQPGVYYHLGMAHERLNHTEEALQAYARGAVFDGDIGDMAYNAFLTLWQKDNRGDTAAELFLDREGDIVEQKFIEKVLKRKIYRKAPDFELEDIRTRNWIRLSDQKGGPVVLCFWAAWSKSSHLLLRELNEIADLYGEDILFMTIATDKALKPVAGYIKKFNLTFPVLVNDKTDVDYEVKGVPMLFVLDEKLNINFTHRGYSPDIRETLPIELDHILNR